MAPAPSALRPALFFDRDGVVNQSPGPGYVNHLDDFHLLPGFADCVRAGAAKGLPSLVVTNQRGVARGLTPPEQLDAMAASAGLALEDRWAGWRREPFGPDSTGHVSVYRRPE